MRNYLNARVENVTYRGVQPREFILISSDGDWEFKVPVDQLDLVTARRLRVVEDTKVEGDDV